MQELHTHTLSLSLSNVLFRTPQDTVAVILMRNSIKFSSAVSQFSTGMLTVARPVLLMCDYTNFLFCALVVFLKSER